MAVTIFSPYEPKAQNRFILYIADLPAYIIKATGLPKLSNGKIKIDYMNVDYKVKGKSTWEDITMTLYDPIDPDGAQRVMNWLRLTHLSEFGIDFTAFGPSSVDIPFIGEVPINIPIPGGSINPLGYKRNISIAYLDPKGNEFSRWLLIGAYVVSADFGEVDWSSDDPVMISLTISYDYATLI